MVAGARSETGAVRGTAPVFIVHALGQHCQLTGSHPYVAASTLVTLNVCSSPSSSLIETYSPGAKAWLPNR
jgi:hypothetical protein